MIVSNFLKAIYKDKVFDSEVLKEGIDGFFDVLELDLDNIVIGQYGFKEIINPDTKKIYISDNINLFNEDIDLDIHYNKRKNKRWISFAGNNDNFCFTYELFFNSNIVNKEEAFLPFKVTICMKNSKSINYDLNLWKANGVMNMVFSKKNGKEQRDYFGIIGKVDFQNLFRIIAKFIEKPQEVFNFYVSCLQDNSPFLFGGANDIANLDEIMIDNTGKKHVKVLKYTNF